MVRRTKEEALATRDSILDAAERLFEFKGVSRTTLQDIAVSAGVTRGAIYWHFEDKSALFSAMMDRARMPLEAVLHSADESDILDPIGDVRQWLLTVFELTANDANTRRVFEIATHKVEYVEELAKVRERRIANISQWLLLAEARIDLAQRRGIVSTSLSPSVTARALLALASGLLQMWLLDPLSFDLVQVGRQIVDQHLASLQPPG